MLYELLDAGGKPSTWFPPRELVEQQIKLKILTSLAYEIAVAQSALENYSGSKRIAFV